MVKSYVCVLGGASMCVCVCVSKGHSKSFCTFIFLLETVCVCARIKLFSVYLSII